MFHTNNFITKEAFPYEKTVHEHRAPTDDSVKLLREMESELKANLLTKFTMNNPFQAIAYVHRSELSFGYTVTWGIKLNGKEFNGEYIIGQKDIALDKRGWKKKMIEKVAQHLTTQMLGKVDPFMKTVFNSRSIL